MFQIIVRKDSTANLSKGMELYLKKFAKRNKIEFQQWVNLYGFRSWSKDYPKQDFKLKFGKTTMLIQFQQNPNYQNNGFEGKTCIVLLLSN